MRCLEDSLADLESRDSSIQLWLGNQDQSPEVIRDFRDTLSADELERAGRFRFQHHRSRFIAARGMLREVLATLLEVAPGQIRFQYGERGKPSLSREFASSDLKFNLSHSDDKVLLAVSIGREVGVDIERIRPDFPCADIAERFFSEWEVVRFLSLPTHARTEAFFNCWTRKEAYVKAIGDGLSCPLDGFDVTLAPGEPARLVATRVEALAAERWTIRDVNASEGYRAAVVVERADGRVTSAERSVDL